MMDAKQLNENGWQHDLNAGTEQKGNHRVNLEFLAGAGLLTPDQTILELGCGIGTMVNDLTAQGLNVIGSDIAANAIEYGRKKYPGIRLSSHSADDLPYEDAAFDCVLSFDVLEHLHAVDTHLREISRVLKPGGYYLLQTPNKYSNALFETLKNKNLSWKRYHPSLHSPGQLKRRFKNHGFQIRFIKMNTINEFTLAKIKKYPPVHFILKHVNFRSWPLWLQTNLYVIAKKQESEL